ncbi:hypothetical protein FBU59_003788 [Linderina macrospora]|uniref:Uncharacterized protein n=1 Tax=Linderina macrospora TaxID=4868 RepID=A0ACC1J7I9_9FUNG|nr:hypothetical protein FBU59_003788 [Linderina macrospora]
MSASGSNTQILANKYSPTGAPSLDIFKTVTVPAPTKDSLKENQVLIRSLYLSIDPYQRNRLTGATDYFASQYELNKPIHNPGSAIVEASTSPDFAVGEIVDVPDINWENLSVIDATALRKVPSGTSARDLVTIFSLPSFTAYVGLTEIGKPKAGETILVSSASGAVGQIVVQIAKARGLRVIGVAGSDDKVEHVKSLGADAAFNYKKCGDYVEAIKKVAPEGIDIYYDSVGGEMLDAALATINDGARIVICGMISQYNKASGEVYGLKNSMKILDRYATVQGFLVGRYYGTATETAFISEVGKLYREGKIQYRVDETVGLENAPQAILNLFEGKNHGKSFVKI